MMALISPFLFENCLNTINEKTAQSICSNKQKRNAQKDAIQRDENNINGYSETATALVTSLGLLEECLHLPLKCAL